MVGKYSHTEEAQMLMSSFFNSTGDWLSAFYVCFAMFRMQTSGFSVLTRNRKMMVMHSSATLATRRFSQTTAE